MVKQELNSVSRETLMEVVQAAGLTVAEQSAYFKCTFEGSPGRIYIAKTNKVTRTDLAGFQLNRPGIIIITPEEAKQLRLGKVQAQIDFTCDEALVVEALTKACEALKAAKAPPKKAKVEAAPANGKTERMEQIKAAHEKQQKETQPTT